MSNERTGGFWAILWRCARVRCPRCGKQKMFLGPFRMKPTCESCGANFDREQGFYLGSIYFNYGITAVLVTASYLAMFVLTDWPEPLKLGLLGAFTVLFPLWFFRRARCLWFGLDQLFDPDADEDKDDSHK